MSLLRAAGIDQGHGPLAGAERPARPAMDWTMLRLTACRFLSSHHPQFQYQQRLALLHPVS